MKKHRLKQSTLKPITACRVCKSKRLQDILSLGEQALSDFIDTANNYPVARYPLEIVLCEGCKLLQMKHTTPPLELYTERYGYRSGINQTMRNELADITRTVEKINKLRSGDIVVDIGCNDGTLLASYKTNGIIRVGFDPVPSFAVHFEKALYPFGEDKMKFINNFFSKGHYLKSFKGKKAKNITAISMFYDLDDPNRFLSDIKACLDPNGLLIIQQNYLVGMLSQNAFDNIVHEHLEYYSLTSLENLLKRHDLEVFDVILNNINGGSFRTLIGNKGSKIENKTGLARVEKIRKQEQKLGLTNPDTYHQFASRVNEVTDKLYKFVTAEVKKGKSVYIYGASTRGNTLIQAAKLDNRHIKAAAERNSDKWGKKIAATGITIISEEQARRNRPDYFLVLPWFFREEFIEREREFLKSGGKMIFPLPTFEVISVK